MIVEVFNNNMEEIENGFNLLINSDFKEFVGEAFGNKPLSLCIAYNEHQKKGLATYMYRVNGKTSNSYSKSEDFKITEDNWKGQGV